jgi:hypothetical protein
MTPDAAAALRARLLALRADTLRQLDDADVISPGFLALMAGIHAALDALDAMPVDAEPADRAVLVDDGETIRLVSYTEARAVATVALSPRCAIGLAGELIAAAHRRL